MKERIKSLPTNYKDDNSSNINIFLDYLEKYNKKWIEGIYENWKTTKIEVYEDKIFLKSQCFITGKNINIIK
jgi:hypothetical protein